MRSRGLIRRKQASCTASASSVVSIVYCIFAMFTILGDRGRSGERSSVRHPDFEGRAGSLSQATIRRSHPNGDQRRRSTRSPRSGGGRRFVYAEARWRRQGPIFRCCAAKCTRNRGRLLRDARLDTKRSPLSPPWLHGDALGYPMEGGYAACKRACALTGPVAVS